MSKKQDANAHPVEGDPIFYETSYWTRVTNKDGSTERLRVRYTTKHQAARHAIFRDKYVEYGPVETVAVYRDVRQEDREGRRIVLIARNEGVHQGVEPWA